MNSGRLANSGNKMSTNIVVLMDGLGGGSSGPVSVLQQTAVAGVAISALKCVRVFNGTASVVSSNTVGDAGSIVGVTTVAGNAGNTITIQTSGPLTDASFSFVEGQIWCGGDGSLTQTPPVSGFNQVIGTSEGAHTIQIGIQQPYLI